MGLEIKQSRERNVVVVRSKAINYLHLVAVVLRDADND